jgi:hypothetical protein
MDVGKIMMAEKAMYEERRHRASDWQEKCMNSL